MPEQRLLHTCQITFQVRYIQPYRSACLTAEEGPKVDLMAIVNYVKSCDEAEGIEGKILDQTDQLPRVLLPMYIVYGI